MIFTSSYKPAGTKTGRLASAKFLAEFGANGQNQADEVRRLFVPRPGYKFIQNDLEGAEAVAVALLAREGNFRELVRRKVKIHNFVCLKIFPEKFERWFTKSQIEALTPQSFHEHTHYKELVKHCKSLPTEYGLAKRTVHGCLTHNHEVFTPAGWIPIEYAVDDPDVVIAVVHTDGKTITFEKPLRRIKQDYSGYIYHYFNSKVNMQVTEDHGVAFWDVDRSTLLKRQALSIRHCDRLSIPCFKNTAGFINDEPLSLLIRPANTTVYCFETSTGYFLCRPIGVVNACEFATGNSNYSMGWKTFQENILKETEGAVVLSAAECKRLLNAYFEIFPEIRIFQVEADKAAQDFLFLQNLFGWEIKVIQRYTAALGRTCVSWRPQSTVGIAGIIGGTRLQNYIERESRRWNVLTITHDSNLSEAPIDEATECANISADCLSFEFISPIDGWKCKIGVEKSVGDNWGKYDEEENPGGLKVIQ